LDRESSLWLLRDIESTDPGAFEAAGWVRDDDRAAGPYTEAQLAAAEALSVELWGRDNPKRPRTRAEMGLR